MLLAAPSARADVFLSMNLSFNNPSNFNSGGTWKIVAKTTNQYGLAGLLLKVTGINFVPATGFIVPPGLDEAGTPPIKGQYSVSGGIHELIVGSDLVPPHTLYIGVIGSPSAYVDPAGITLYGANPNLGSFTGGVEIATGSFNAGTVPAWAATNLMDNNVFTTASGLPIAGAPMQTTVRFISIVPESPAIPFAAAAIVAIAAAVVSVRRLK